MKVVWPITSLGNEIDLLAGFAFKSARYTNDNEAIRLLRGDNIIQGCLRWEDVKKWPADDVATYNDYQLRDGDVVLAMDRPWVKAGLKHAMISEDDLPCLLVQRTARLRPTKNLDNRFLMYLIGSDDFVRHTLGVQTGIGVPHISGQQIKDFQFRLPPLAEQRRIVGILDEAFEGLATAKANAQQNLQNARDLFESHLQAVFTQRGDGWVETTIGAEIKFIDYRGKTPVKTASGVRLITAKNVKMGYLQETPMEFIAAASYKAWMTRGIPRNGDVLFTTEAPLANVAQLNTDEKVAFAQRIIIMQPNAARLDSTFLKYLLLSQPVQQRIRTKGTGATVQGIKASLLKLIGISFPKSLAAQKQIVTKLDALRTETQRLESLYQRKLAALDELKKSLLHRAFRGEL